MTPPNGKSLSCSVGPLFKRSYDSSVGLELTSSSSDEGGEKQEAQLEHGSEEQRVVRDAFDREKKRKK